MKHTLQLCFTNPQPIYPRTGISCIGKLLASFKKFLGHAPTFMLVICASFGHRSSKSRQACEPIRDPIVQPYYLPRIEHHRTNVSTILFKVSGNQRTQ